MTKNKTLIIGRGEIGQSLGNVLEETYEVHYLDKNPELLTNVEDQYDVINICIPYTDEFVDIVKINIESFKPKLCIIHSTVPPGTTDACGDICVHSFVSGKHPNLEQGIKTFTKFCGGARAEEASKIFSDLGIKTKCYPDARTTEAMKIWSTTYYFWDIVFMKELHQWCEDNNLDFDAVYTESNKDYNEGYEKIGNREYIRQDLKYMPGAVGGHCLVPNASLIKSSITDLCLEFNEKYAKEE